jgi:uncharacterized protein (TIGR02145 family)/uncharacterized repeat protein (TIGR02543 family)
MIKLSSFDYSQLVKSVSKKFTLVFFLLLSLFATCILAQTDVAQGKTIWASSQENDNGTVRYANLANDGNDGTRWSSNYTDPQLITIDLGGQFSINNVILMWETASARNYTVSISSDTVNFTPIITKSNMSASTNRKDTLSCSGIGRYIRMTGTQRTTTYGYSLFSFKVYGVALYSISFNPNGGTGSMGTQFVYSSTPVNLIPNEFTRTGFSFAGWATSVNGSVVYVNNSSITCNSNTTLYAVWNTNQYTISYNLNDGTNNASNPSTYTITTPTITLLAPLRNTYVFGGWYTNTSLTGTPVTSISQGSTGNLTVYAKWTANNLFTLSVISSPTNGGTITLDPPGNSYSLGENVTITAIPSHGFTFESWSGVNATQPTVAITISGDRIIAANFTDATTQILQRISALEIALQQHIDNNNHTYTVSFNAGSDAQNIPSNQTITHGNKATTPTQNPTRQNYPFSGWYKDAECTVPFIFTSEVILYNTVVYAKWGDGTTLTDIDGNIYNLITFGNQTWTKENLKTTTFNDNTSILNITDNTEWANATVPGYCAYNNDPTIMNTEGALYNGLAVNTGKLAPAGWHVATAQDWRELTNYLITNGYNFDHTLSGNKIAQSVASTTGWNNAPEHPGSAGYNPLDNNRSGFSAYPNGLREATPWDPQHPARFSGRGITSNWWALDIVNHYTKYGIYYIHQNLNESCCASPTTGMAVRLVKDR